MPVYFLSTYSKPSKQSSDLMPCTVFVEVSWEDFISSLWRYHFSFEQLRNYKSLEPHVWFTNGLAQDLRGGTMGDVTEHQQSIESTGDLYIFPDVKTMRKIQSFWLVTHLATKSLLTSRKIKKHSSFGVNARCARRLLLSSLRLLRSMTCRSISSAMGGGDMGSEIMHPAGHARLFT